MYYSSFDRSAVSLSNLKIILNYVFNQYIIESEVEEESIFLYKKNEFYEKNYRLYYIHKYLSNFSFFTTYVTTYTLFSKNSKRLSSTTSLDIFVCVKFF